jgi:hypothetical protein
MFLLHYNVILSSSGILVTEQQWTILLQGREQQENVAVDSEQRYYFLFDLTIIILMGDANQLGNPWFQQGVSEIDKIFHK